VTVQAWYIEDPEGLPRCTCPDDDITHREKCPRRREVAERARGYVPPPLDLDTPMGGDR
jgi:hypothetical protein